MFFYIFIPSVIIFLIILFFAVTFVCFRMTFYAPKKRKNSSLPVGGKFEQYKDLISGWADKTAAIPYEDVYVKSFDGLTLHGKFYEYQKGAPIEIMFHGYRGTVERDLCGGVLRCFKLKRSALLVDQRASGKSDGNVITFGVKERYDCAFWAEYAYNRFGDKVKLFLTGISMGAATVLMASSMPLPKTVVGVVADCGYSTPKDIIKLTVKKMKLPPTLFYAFIKLGAKIYGKFNLEEFSPVEAMKSSRLPVLFIHGDEDNFVPAKMSYINYDACTTKKRILIVKGASHGMSYPVNQDEYIKAVNDFYTTNPELN